MWPQASHPSKRGFPQGFPFSNVTTPDPRRSTNSTAKAAESSMTASVSDGWCALLANREDSSGPQFSRTARGAKEKSIPVALMTDATCCNREALHNKAFGAVPGGPCNPLHHSWLFRTERTCATNSWSSSSLRRASFRLVPFIAATRLCEAFEESVSRAGAATEGVRERAR